MKKLLLFCMCLMVATALIGDTYIVIVDVKEADYLSQKSVYTSAFTNLLSSKTTTWQATGRVVSRDATKDIYWYQLPTKLTGVDTTLLAQVSSGKDIPKGFELVEVKTDIQPLGTNILIKVKKRSRSSNTNAIQQVL